MDSPIMDYLRHVHAEIAELREGAPYSVGPRGVRIDPDDFGICLATVDGYVYEVGTTRKRFSMQSLSKPFTYGLALEDLGTAAVDEKVDVEPSGDSFTEISLAPRTGRPANAMINAGALAVAAMIKGAGGRSAVERIEELYSAFAGRPLRSNARVFAAERRHSDHNHALAYLLSSFGIITSRPTAALETYLRQCAVQVTCRDLSLMAATLANSGTHPHTGAQVLGIDAVERVLSVMMTSGMYDDAGDWVSSVGMPAKSGVGGGTIAVLPGQAGLAVFSPPLDEHGSSVRGVATCRRLSRDTDMHFVRAARAGRSVIGATYPVTAAPSPIRRTEEATAALREHGERAVVIELVGDLLFAGTESMIREISALPDEVEIIVLDVRRVDEISRVALDMLRRTVRRLAETDRAMVLVDPDDVFDGVFTAGQVPSFDTLGTAVAHCEDELLAHHAADLPTPAVVPVSQSPVLAALQPQDVAALAARMEPRSYTDGEVVRRIGQRFSGIYFILSGRITSTARVSSGRRVELSTLSAGMTFGELALGSDERQGTTQRAQGAAQVMLLSSEAIDLLEVEDPRLAVELWRALTRHAFTRVEQHLRETAARPRD